MDSNDSEFNLEEVVKETKSLHEDNQRKINYLNNLYNAKISQQHIQGVLLETALNLIFVHPQDRAILQLEFEKAFRVYLENVDKESKTTGLLVARK